MTYVQNIPQSGESLGSTQARINTNFDEIAIVNAVNHVAFNAGGKGKHTFLQMPKASAPTTAADEGGLYTKLGASPAEINLFYRGQSNGKEYQMTRVDQANNATFGTDTNYQLGPPSLTGGWTFLPGGLVMQWGIDDVASNSTSRIMTFPIPFPTKVFNINITGLRAASSPGNTDAYVSTGYALDKFTIYNNGGHSFQFFWQAIGN